MRKVVILALTLFAVSFLLSSLATAGKITSLKPIDIEKLRMARLANNEVRPLKVHQTASKDSRAMISSNGECDRTMTWRTLEDPSVNFGFANEGDSSCVVFQAPGDLKIKAIRLMSFNYVGNVLVDIWESNYALDIFDTELMDSNGWLSGGTHPSGLTTPLGDHVAGPVAAAVDSPFSEWITIPIPGEPTVNKDEYFGVGMWYSITDGWGFATENPYGGPGSFFKYYAECCGPDGANVGWFLRSNVLWTEVVVELTGDTSPDFVDWFILSATVSTDPRDVCATVADFNCAGGPAGVAHVYVNYGTDGVTFDQAELVSSGDEWCGQIPGYPSGTTVYYYYSAVDVEGNTSRTVATYSYYIWEATTDILLVYNANDFDTWIDYYYMYGCFDICGNPYVYDFWHVPSHGPLVAEAVHLYETIVVVEGSFPAADLPIGAIHDWLAAGSIESPHNLFFSSQDYGCYVYGCETTDFVPGDFEYDFLGVATLGPQDINGGSPDPYPIDPVCSDPYYGSLCAHGGQFQYDPGGVLGTPNWIDDLTANPLGTVCFTDPNSGGADCGVHVEGDGFNTVFLPFDVLGCNWDDPYDWIIDVRNMIDPFLDEWHQVPLKDKEESIQDGLEWLVAQQNENGSWSIAEGDTLEGYLARVAKTAFAVLKLEDRAYELGYDPLSEEYVYHQNVMAGLNYLFGRAEPVDIWMQPAGDPDSEGDGWAIGCWDEFATYETGIAMMAIAASKHPEMIVTAPGILTGWTYKRVLQNMVDYLAFSQYDEGATRGGWSYWHNDEWCDNSNSGYAVLGLRYSESEEYGFECFIPGFVKTELDIWITNIQDPVDGDGEDGGSYYRPGEPWCNLLRTGNLLFEMAFVGDDTSIQRVKDAIDYIERHWDDPYSDPGWRGNYQAMYCLMKGLESLNVDTLLVHGLERDWFEELVIAITCSQNEDGSWPQDNWGDLILATEWALLTLEKVAPVYVSEVPLDIKPTSCPNPLNLRSNGVLPVAILGTEEFDVTTVDPSTVLLEGVAPLRWSIRDVSTPFVGALCGCGTDGADGFDDLTLKFDKQAVVAALGDVYNGEELELTLMGALYDETLIRGQDCVLIRSREVAPPDEEPPPEDGAIEVAINAGLAWLVAQQNDDGSWSAVDGDTMNGWSRVGKTGFAVVKLADRAYETGFDPFSEEYEYSQNFIAGLNYLFSMATPVDIWMQPAGDPDSEGDGSAVGMWYDHATYETGIAMMAIAATRHPEMVVTVPGAVSGWTYQRVLQNMVDYFAFGQCDQGSGRGGWSYWHNDEWCDNSNSGYAVLGLRYADSDEYGFACTIPAFVKSELNIWINTIQDPVDGDDNDGGSDYCVGCYWFNVLKTGNLLFEMAFVGDDVSVQRVIDALDYIERHWDDPDPDPGWKIHYQAMYCLMKGFESLGIGTITVSRGGEDVEVDWFQEFANAIIFTQNPDGSWPWDYWGDEILATEWALLTLEKVAPVYVVEVPIDVKPTSCPNPLNTKSRGALPVAIVGTEEFDVTSVDPATVLLEGVEASSWAVEDVATLFEGELCGCTTDGADGFDDLALKFDTQEIVAVLGEVQDGEEVVLTLAGELTDGTSIQGSDCVVIRHKAKCKVALPLPDSYVLIQNNPNPFNPETEIRFGLPEAAEVNITVYNILGQTVDILVDSELPAGYHAVRWNGEDFASGVYFYRLTTGDFTATRRMVLMR